MEPLQWIREFSKQNPQAATLLFGGVACFAAVAAVGGMGIDVESKIRPALYIIGVGVILIITTAIFNNRLIISVLSWFVVIMLGIWVILFIVSRFNSSDSIACAVYFWETCRTTTDNSAKLASSTVPAVQPVQLAAPSTIKPGNYKVLVQFAGVLRRSDVRTMMESLQKAGWNVQGVEGGGQRIPAYEGSNEIRYGADADASAAKALADMVQATKIVSGAISISKNPKIDNGTLEIWIRR